MNESNANMAAVLAGLGIKQAARFAVAPYLATGELVEVLPDWSHPLIPIYVVYPPTGTCSRGTWLGNASRR